MIYETSERQRNKVMRFALKQLQTSSHSIYRKRGGSTKNDVLQRQIAVGKLAEMVAYEWLSKYISEEITSPDFEALKRSDKSYAADLTSKSLDFHVKAQTDEQARKYGASWVFQREDPLLSEPTYKDTIVLCRVSNNLTLVSIVAVIKAQTVVGLYMPLKSKRLSRTKEALYEDTLSQAGALGKSLTEVGNN